MNIFKALFGGRKSQADEKRTVEKDFDMLKSDGLCALKQRQFGHAVQCFVQALELNADLECRDGLSQAYIALGDLPHAYEQLQQIADACPDNVEVLMRIADVCCRMNNYTAMADAMEKALLAGTSNEQVYYMYAKACHKMGDSTNAVAMLTKAIKLKDDFWAARLLRGEVLLDCGEVEEAAEDADCLCSMNGGSEDALLLKERVQKARKQGR